MRPSSSIRSNSYGPHATTTTRSSSLESVSSTSSTIANYDNNNKAWKDVEPAAPPPAAASQGGLVKKSTAIKKKKTVSFNERVRIRKTIHINEYSDEEVTSVWYTPRESTEMRQEALFVAQLAKDGLLPASGAASPHSDSSEDARYCLRGIEMYTGSEQATQRQQRKEAIRWALLKEMEFQYDEGAYDPAYIAELYSKASRSCAASARARGLEDEINALLLR